MRAERSVSRSVVQLMPGVPLHIALCLLNVMGKILDRMMLPFMEPVGDLSERNYGSWETRSMIDAVAMVVDMACLAY